MIKLLKKENLPKFGLLKIGYISFYLGVFFLSSALPIALLFFLISIFIIIFKERSKFFFSNDLLPLYFASFLIIFSTFYSIYLFKPIELAKFDSSISWVSIFNWIPLFIAYRAFQYYLKTDRNKITFINVLISGTFPVLFSILGQILFKWHGPYATLGDSIIWFQKPINFNNNNSIGGVGGLFSNPNYAAYWLSTIFPFSIFIFKSKLKIFEKFFSFLLISTFIYCIILTDSRNGFFGILIGGGLIIGFKCLFMIFITLLFISIFYLLTKSFLPVIIIEFADSLMQRSLLLKLTNINFGNVGQFNRINIFLSTLKLITLKPIFGWLAGSFPIMFLIVDLSKNEEVQHAHNLPLQLAFDYGLTTSILICSFILYLYVKVSKRLFVKEKNPFSFLVFKTWMASSFVSIFFHLSDIPYYDGKVSILFWIFLAGIKTYIDHDYVDN